TGGPCGACSAWLRSACRTSAWWQLTSVKASPAAARKPNAGRGEESRENGVESKTRIANTYSSDWMANSGRVLDGSRSLRVETWLATSPACQRQRRGNRRAFGEHRTEN